jgi:hypothetical protein
MNDSRSRLERVRAPVSDEELISDIRRLAELAGTNVVSFRLYSERGNYAPQTAAARFGTWNKALMAAGLEIASERDITDERLFEDLIRLWHVDHIEAWSLGGETNEKNLQTLCQTCNLGKSNAL